MDKLCSNCGHLGDVHWSENKNKYGHPRPRWICGGNLKTQGFCECPGFRVRYSPAEILDARMVLDIILRRTQA